MIRPRVMAFVAPSGTGKTTLIEALVGLAVQRGLRVAALKHDAHGFDIDRPGKDSHRFTAAGAAVTLIASDDQLAMVRRQACCPDPAELVARYADGADLVLIEGWKTSDLPRIEVHRPGLGRPLLAPDHPHLVAVAADAAPTAPLTVPILDLNNPAAVLDFILDRAETP